MSKEQIVWDQAMLEKYNYSGPRYTSYPTAVEFHEAFTISDLDMACADHPERPLSLYIHIPFAISFAITVAVIKSLLVINIKPMTIYKS